MKYLIVSLVSLALISCKMDQKTATQWNVASPDSSINFAIYTQNGNVFYTVLHGADTVIGASPLGIKTSAEQFESQLTFVKAENVKSIDEKYIMLTGKRKENHNHANELVVTFENANKKQIQIASRAYNNGVAFRYQFAEGNDTITVEGESTGFAIPLGGIAWLSAYDKPTDYTPGYENSFTNGSPIGEQSKDSFGWYFPALFHTANHWMMLTESNLDKNYFASHLQPNSDGGVYKLRGPEQADGQGFYSVKAVSKAPFNTPWRTIMIGNSLNQIVESNLVFDLADERKVVDASWVKPGRSSWNWWGEHDGSKKFSSLKNFVDLSKEMGWEYSLVDANWDIMEGGNVEQLIKYAKTKDIGLSLWYNSGGVHNNVSERPRDIMSNPEKRKAEFKKLNEWGVKCVKIDFFQSDKQEIIKLYLDILKDAADENILVVFHGCTLPRGWERTYPNLMSMEAVRGAEQYGWDSAFALEAPTLNTVLALSRNVVGSMDYTPVTFSSYEGKEHITTNAHELALAVVFESGMLHFADRAAPYRALDAKIKSYLQILPVAWDDTKLLQGTPSKDVVLARQKGKDWFVAGINGEKTNKSITINPSFLAANEKYDVMIMKDGAKPAIIAVEQLQDATNSGAINIEVLPFGGFSIWFKAK